MSWTLKPLTREHISAAAALFNQSVADGEMIFSPLDEAVFERRFFQPGAHAFAAEENGELIGFDTELAKAVCEKIGVEADFIEINWDSKEIELNSKNIDCIWNGMCITEERKQNMSVSDPYLLNTQALVMKADREDAIMADVTGLTVVAEHPNQHGRS